MSNFKRTTIAASLLTLSSSVFAGTMGPVAEVQPRFYVGVQGGDSISANTHFQPQISYPLREQSFFYPPTNSDFTRDIGSEGFAGAFIGYSWRPNLAFQFSYDYRNGYEWNIYTSEDDFVNAPDVYDRFLASSIRIQTFLFDMILKPTVEWGRFVPYVKGGIGVASNKIQRLQNIDVPLTRTLGFNVVVNGKTTSSFSWDAGVGVDYSVDDKFTVGLGYRLVDAGALKTSRNETDYTPVRVKHRTVTPFETKHIFLNEILISAAYHFDYI